MRCGSPVSKWRGKWQQYVFYLLEVFMGCFKACILSRWFVAAWDCSMLAFAPASHEH